MLTYKSLFSAKTKLSTVINTLFVSYDGMTDPLGQSQVIPYMQGLIKAGYRVTILSCEKPGIYEERRAIIQKILDDSGIEWVALPYTKRPAVLSTLYDTWRLKRAAAVIHRKKNLQLVHTRSGTPALVGLWLKKKFGIRFLHDIRDFYADSRVDSGSWNQDSWLYRNVYRYLKKAEAEQLSACDGAVCLTYAAEKIIRSLPEFDAHKPLAVIPCSVDVELFNAGAISPAEKKDLTERFNIHPDDVIVSYLGSIGGWYLVKEMMQFFAMLMERIPTAKFLFITPHSPQEILQIAAQYSVPPDKLISAKGMRTEIPRLLSLSRYSIFFIKPCFSKQASSPTKHGELMAMGIPVITNSGVGDMEMIVRKYNGGILLNEFNEISFNEAIEQLQRTVFDKDQIRSGAIEFYALSQAVEKYTSMYQQVLTRS